MRIVTTHVTRMASGFCCVAGLSEREHVHIRPVIGQRLPTFLLVPFGGPFDMGAVVDLGEVSPAGKPPEVEDQHFWVEDATLAGYVGKDRLWSLLQEGAQDDLWQIFGADLEQHEHRAWVSAGRGKASLGVYSPRSQPVFREQGPPDSPRLRILLEDESLNFSLTDARYFRTDFSVPHLARVRAAQASIAAGVEVLLGVGLTRPFAREGETESNHWLQVNALHLADNPGLRLAPEP